VNVVMIGPFGLHPKGTMRARALPAARALAHRGHRVTVLMPPWHTPADAGRAWCDAEADVQCEYVSLAGLRLPAAGHLLVARRLAARASALAPDVVHAFKPKAYSGLAAAALRARQRIGRPFGLVMDTDDWEGPGGWNDLEPYTRPQRLVFAYQERWGLCHADAVTAASRRLLELAVEAGAQPGAVTYVPNALDRLPPASGAVGRDGPPAVLLYTRFFEFDLGQPLDVLATVRRSVPSARLVVAGKGLFGEESRFLDLARRRGLDDAVEYAGWLDADRVAQVLAGAQVAIYPFDDTLVNRTKSPVKLLELLGAGVPVVAHAVGELAQVIQDRQSGLLVAAGDTAAMAAAVVELLRQPERRAAIGRAARERIAHSYLWSSRAVALEAVYASVSPRS
jgi:glycosyltransferase involved in cell wall biosynthesis